MATRYVMYSRSNYQLTTSCQNCRGIHLQASDSIPEAYLSRRLALNLWSLPQVPPVDVPRLFPPSTLSRYHYSTINSLILITIADNSPSDPMPKSHLSMYLALWGAIQAPWLHYQFTNSRCNHQQSRPHPDVLSVNVSCLSPPAVLYIILKSAALRAIHAVGSGKSLISR